MSDPDAVIDAAGRLAFLREMEHPEERSTQTPPIEECGIRRVERLLDGGRWRQVKTLTHHHWREMGPHDRRALLDWAVRQQQLLEEKISFMSRNMAAGELELPEQLRDRRQA